MTRILGISGSLHEASHTRQILALALESAAAAGAETRLLDLRQAALPLFNPDSRDIPAYHQVRETVLWAEAFILATPDYHGSMSGTLKNFLDYYWHEFMGKLFGIIVASHEKGLTVQDQLRTIIRQCYGWSLPYGLDVHTRHDFGPEGELANERLHHRLEMFAHDMAVYGGLLHARFLADRASDPPTPSFAHFAKHGYAIDSSDVNILCLPQRQRQAPLSGWLLECAPRHLGAVAGRTAGAMTNLILIALKTPMGRVPALVEGRRSNHTTSCINLSQVHIQIAKY